MLESKNPEGRKLSSSAREVKGDVDAPSQSKTLSDPASSSDFVLTASEDDRNFKSNDSQVIKSLPDRRGVIFEEHDFGDSLRSSSIGVSHEINGFSNQDIVDVHSHCRSGLVFVVNDGLGGGVGGAWLAKTLNENLKRALNVSSNLAEAIKVAKNGNGANVLSLTELCKNYKFFEDAGEKVKKSNRNLNKMGTTISSVSVSPDGEVKGYYEGDSPMYIFRDGKIIAKSNPDSELHYFLKVIEIVANTRSEDKKVLLRLIDDKLANQSILKRAQRAIRDFVYTPPSLPSDWLTLKEKIEILRDCFLDHVKEEIGKLKPKYHRVLRDSALTKYVKIDNGQLKETESSEWENLPKLEPGDIVLLATDGFFPGPRVNPKTLEVDTSSVVTDKDLERILRKYRTLEEIHDALKKLALEKGSTDDMSMVLFSYMGEATQEKVF